MEYVEMKTQMRREMQDMAMAMARTMLAEASLAPFPPLPLPLPPLPPPPALPSSQPLPQLLPQSQQQVADTIVPESVEDARDAQNVAVAEVDEHVIEETASMITEAIAVDEDVEMAADVGSKHKKNRRKKKKATSPSPESDNLVASPAPSPVVSDELPSQSAVAQPATAVGNRIVALPKHITEPFPTTLHQAGGEESARAWLVESGVLTQAVAKLSPHAGESMFRKVATLPYLGAVEHGAREKRMRLMESVVGAWMFCGEVVSIEHHPAGRFVVLADADGRECRAPMVFLDHTTIVPHQTTYCCFNAFHVFTDDETALPWIGFHQYPDERKRELFTVPVPLQEIKTAFDKLLHQDITRQPSCWNCKNNQLECAAIPCDKCETAQYCSVVCKKSGRYAHKKVCAGENSLTFILLSNILSLYSDWSIPSIEETC